VAFQPREGLRAAEQRVHAFGKRREARQGGLGLAFVELGPSERELGPLRLELRHFLQALLVKRAVTRELGVALGLTPLPQQEASESVVPAWEIGGQLHGAPVGRLGLVEPSERFEGPAVVQQDVGGFRGELDGRLELGKRAVVGARPGQCSAQLRAGVSRGRIRVRRGGKDLERRVGASSLAIGVAQEEQQRDSLRALLAGGLELLRSVEEAFLLDQRPAVARRQIRIVGKLCQGLVHGLVSGGRLTRLPVELGERGPVGGDTRLPRDHAEVRLGGTFVAGEGVRLRQDPQGRQCIGLQGDGLFELPGGLPGAPRGLERQAVDVTGFGGLRPEGGGQPTLVHGFPGLFLSQEGEGEVAVHPGIRRRSRHDLPERFLGALVVLLGEESLSPGEGLVGFGNGRGAHEHRQDGNDYSGEHRTGILF
jgi:hypothetical protein